MHELVRSNDCINGASAPAVVAADTRRLINDRDGRLNGFGQWHDLSAEQSRNSANRIVAARRTQIDGGGSVNDRRRVRLATRISALGALGLRQQVIDLLHKVAAIGRW